MRETWIVIQREYLERVRTKAFIVSTIVVPAFIFLMIGLPAKLATMKASQAQRIVLATANEQFATTFDRQLAISARDNNVQYSLLAELKTTEEERAALRQRLDAGKIDGFLWAPDDALAARKITYTGRSTSDFVGFAALRRALTQSTIERALSARGFSVEEVRSLQKPVELETIQFQAGKESKQGGAGFIFAIGMALFLYMTLILYGVAVMRGVQQEKTSRIVEVLLASVTPKALMAGKIIGVGAVGLTQVIIWATAGAIFSVQGLVAMKAMGIELAISPVVMAFFPVFFVLGFLLNSASFAALGAAVSNDQDAQQFTFIVMAPIILSMLMMNLVIRQPSAPMSVFFSLFPFTAPILMYLRIAVQQPPWWQIGLCIALLCVTTWLMMSLCARIYRVGVLMYGKRPTLPEIIKWLKYA